MSNENGFLDIAASSGIGATVGASVAGVFGGSVLPLGFTLPAFACGVAGATIGGLVAGGITNTYEDNYSNAHITAGVFSGMGVGTFVAVLGAVTFGIPVYAPVFPALFGGLLAGIATPSIAKSIQKFGLSCIHHCARPDNDELNLTENLEVDREYEMLLRS